MRPRAAFIVALLLGTAARAELSPGEAALLSTGVTVAGVTAGTAIALAGALKADSLDPNALSPARIAAGCVVGGLALLLGPSTGRLATGTPARNLLLFRGAVLGAGGIAAFFLLWRHDTTASNAGAAILVAPVGGILLLGSAAVDIFTTPSDVEAHRLELHAGPGGATLVAHF